MPLRTSRARASAASRGAAPAARRATLAALALAAIATLLPTATADAHGFSTTVYVDATEPAPDTVRTRLELEYDLLVVSAADAEQAPDLFDEGMAAWQTADESTALAAHADTVLRYVTERFDVTAGGQVCTPTQVGGFEATQREGVPYTVLTLDNTCGRHAAAHTVRSGLFGDAEGYVIGAVTIVQYEGVDGRSGSAALKPDSPSFSTVQPASQRFREFFVLGVEHLLFGIDHILFLLALIVGSRRLRDVVLAASSFTVAHSATFVLAALGAVNVPAAVVEPVIALSIAFVAAWHLWNLRTARGLEQPEHAGWLGMGAADWSRLVVVFGFGLVHGLGFAGALGIDEPFSWTLLWSLLVFNVGIEVVQVSIIALVLPLLTLLRRRVPGAGRWVGGAVAAGVMAMGLTWFVQRVAGAA